MSLQREVMAGYKMRDDEIREAHLASNIAWFLIGVSVSTLFWFIMFWSKR